MQLGVGVDGADAALDLGQLSGVHQIGLVEDDHIGEGDLVLGLGRVLQAVAEPFGVGHGHDSVKARALLHVLVHEEGLGDGGGVREARGLHDDRVELALALHQAFHDADEIAAHGAADAAVVHLEDFLVRAHHEVVIDADLAEFVDDDRVALAMLLAEDAVQQGGLARAQIAGEDGDGDLGRGGVGHWCSLSISYRPNREGRALFAPPRLQSGIPGKAALVSRRERGLSLPYIVPGRVYVSPRSAIGGRKSARRQLSPGIP